MEDENVPGRKDSSNLVHWVVRMHITVNFQLELLNTKKGIVRLARAQVSRLTLLNWELIPVYPLGRWSIHKHEVS